MRISLIYIRAASKLVLDQEILFWEIKFHQHNTRTNRIEHKENQPTQESWQLNQKSHHELLYVYWFIDSLLLIRCNVLHLSAN